MKLNLSKACSSRGADMGRPNRLPSDILAPIKLRMERLKWVDGDYDAGGSYWGGGSGDFIYCAWCVPHNKISGNPSPLVQVRSEWSGSNGLTGTMTPAVLIGGAALAISFIVPGVSRIIKSAVIPPHSYRSLYGRKAGKMPRHSYGTV